MTQEETKTRFAKYLKSNFIKFDEVTENGIVSYRMTYDGYEFCPEKSLNPAYCFILTTWRSVYIL